MAAGGVQRGSTWRPGRARDYSLRYGGYGLGDCFTDLETAGGHANGGLVAIGADDETGGAKVDRPDAFLHGRPIDDHFDVGAYRKGASAAKPGAGGTEIAGGSRAPARGSATLGHTEMNGHVDAKALAEAPVFIY